MWVPCGFDFDFDFTPEPHMFLYAFTPLVFDFDQPHVGLSQARGTTPRLPNMGPRPPNSPHVGIPTVFFLSMEYNVPTWVSEPAK